MIFPHEWLDTPVQHIAKLIWNNCERFHISCPLAPNLFGIIVGKKGEKQ